MSNFSWNERAILALRTFWNEGVSTAEIGRRLGCGKSSAISKAHRLKLTGRPSPILNRRPRREARPPRARSGAQTLPPLVSVPVALKVLAECAGRPVAPPVAEPPAAALPAVVAPPDDHIPGVPDSPPSRACCWPMWGNERPTHRYCGGPRMGARPYCEDHAAKAYMRVRDPQAAPEPAQKFGWMYGSPVTAQMPA